MNRLPPFLIAAALIAGCCGCGGSGKPRPAELSPQRLAELQKNAWDNLVAGRADEARRLAEQILEQQPDSIPALLCAGQAAVKQGNDDDALRFYQRIPDDGSTGSLVGLSLCGDLLLFRKGRRAEAERKFAQALKRDPNHPQANLGMGQLCQITGRRRDSEPFLLRAVKAGQTSINVLVMLGWSNAAQDRGDVLRLCLSQAPADKRPLLGLARLAYVHGEWQHARELVERLIAAHPDHAEARAFRGLVLLETGDTGDLAKWNSALPAAARDYPDTWYVRGRLMQRLGRPKAAIRCFWECARRDPDHRAADYELAQLLIRSGATRRAAPYVKRARDLQTLDEVYKTIYVDGFDARFFRRAIRLTESLGRFFEAWALVRVWLKHAPDDAALKSDAKRLKARITTGDLARTQPEFNPALQDDFSTYPLPERVRAAKPVVRSEKQPDVPVRFADVTKSAGIAFSYFSKDDPGTAGMRLPETNGGGIAVLDYDRDGWPDLYFPQGREFPPRRERDGEYRDRLYRNRGTGTFADVTGSARLGDADFSHGATVGDYNADGLPDLYVTNIGRNRLYRNNGDGTFSDVTAEAGLETSLWTVSAAFADLNNDGLPELYDVNYLSGREALFKICTTRQGHKRGCTPAHFIAEQDQLFLNAGDGRFTNVTKSSGITVPDGKGMGILVADLDRSGRLSLFVGNDGTANFLFRNQTKPGKEIRFAETGIGSGVAFRNGGLAQSTMGIAADDADGNGRLDFFVTNFYDDYNTLYLHDRDARFDDRTREAGLRQASYHKLGFGTQFLDADLDGWPDLVVANGHVDDFTHLKRPFRMKPQFFRNRGAARFREQDAASLGPYFQRNLLGRGLATLDFNRDGRPDFVVSHLDAPAALLANTTRTGNHWIAVRLNGTASNRDAVGATITARFGERTIVKQLTAGDGYLASNDRRLLIGLGNHASVDELEVRWISGRAQRFRRVAADRAYIAVEGRGELLPAPR